MGGLHRGEGFLDPLLQTKTPARGLAGVVRDERN